MKNQEKKKLVKIYADYTSHKSLWIFIGLFFTITIIFLKVEYSLPPFLSSAKEDPLNPVCPAETADYHDYCSKINFSISKKFQVEIKDIHPKVENIIILANFIKKENVKEISG